MSGIFITFEGADATGKTTQLKLLSEVLTQRNIAHVLTREPGGTEDAERIRNLVLDAQTEFNERAELLLYLAARAEHVEKLIKPTLAMGKLVLCDRFTDSTLAYQGLARGLGLETVLTLNDFATGGLLPDVTFLLHTSAAVSEQRRLGRGSTDRMETQSAEFKERVRQGFLELQSRYPERICLLDAERSVPELHAQIIKYVERLLESKNVFG